VAGDGDRWRSFSAVAAPLGELGPGKGTLGAAGGVPDGARELDAWFVPKTAPNYLGGGGGGGGAGLGARGRTFSGVALPLGE